MNHYRFDDLSRRLTGMLSRRGALAGLAGAVFTALPLTLASEEAAAGKKGRRRKDKRRRNNRRQPQNVPPAVCTPDCTGKTCGDDGCGGSCGDCRADQVCQDGTCACPTGEEESGGVCATPPICGGQANSCTRDESCCSGVCLPVIGCSCSLEGLPCRDNGDCCATLTCRGFTCRA